jgi:hypothetical protein
MKLEAWRLMTGVTALVSVRWSDSSTESFRFAVVVMDSSAAAWSIRRYRIAGLARGSYTVVELSESAVAVASEDDVGMFAGPTAEESGSTVSLLTEDGLGVFGAQEAVPSADTAALMSEHVLARFVERAAAGSRCAFAYMPQAASVRFVAPAVLVFGSTVALISEAAPVVLVALPAAGVLAGDAALAEAYGLVARVWEQRGPGWKNQ